MKIHKRYRVSPEMPDFSLELQFSATSGAPVCGIDEAGRGPWAGPVVAAAAWLDQNRLEDDLREGLDDSKKLSAKRRARLYEALQQSKAVVFALGEASVDEIDLLNILQATHLAMRRAYEGLAQKMPEPPLMALIDGNKAPLLSCATRAVVKGDSLSLSIAAASICAKEHRDHLMAQLAAEYPGYGWEKNAGYGTKDHQIGLANRGVTPHHRRSFAPVRKLVQGA